MENTGLSASDALLLGGGANGGLGGLGGFGGIIGLLAVLGMINNGGLFGNGNTGVAEAAMLNRYQPQYATQQDVQYTAQFGQLLDGNRDIINNVTSGAAQSVAATNQAKYDSINVAKDIQMYLSNQISDVKTMEQNILENQNACCCATKQLILEKAAATDLQLAQMEARLNQKMDANTITGLRDRVSALELDKATAGMLKFPNSWSYGAGPFPPIFGGCPSNNF